MPPRPRMRALSIRQPYAELILRGIKTIEYRSRRTRIIGERFYIYASTDTGQLAIGNGAESALTPAPYGSKTQASSKRARTRAMRHGGKTVDSRNWPIRRRMGPIFSPTANCTVSRAWICWRRVVCGPNLARIAMGRGDEVHTIFKLLTHHDFGLG